MYEADHASAHADVAEAGFVAAFSVRVPGVLDETTNRTAAGTVVPYPGVALRKRGSVRMYEALGLVQTEAVTLFWVPDTQGQLPPLEATIVLDGVAHAVKSVDPLAPSGVADAIAATIIVGR